MDDYGKLQPIADAITKLEDDGDIKCGLPECGDVGCASSVLWNALAKVMQDNPNLF